MYTGVVQSVSCVWHFCNPIDCSLTVFSAHEISQVRILVWVAISSFRGSSWPRDQTCVSCIGKQNLCHWATKEAQCAYIQLFLFQLTRFTQLIILGDWRFWARVSPNLHLRSFALRTELGLSQVYDTSTKEVAFGKGGKDWLLSDYIMILLK